MPTLQELDSLKDLINKLGDEPEFMAQRGERIAEPPADDYGVDYYAQTAESADVDEEEIDSTLSSHAHGEKDEDVGADLQDSDDEAGYSGGGEQDEGTPDYSDDYSEITSQDFILDDDELVQDVSPVEAGEAEISPQDDFLPPVSLAGAGSDVEDREQESPDSGLVDQEGGEGDSKDSGDSGDSIEIDLEEFSPDSSFQQEFPVKDLSEEFENLSGDFEDLEEDLEDIVTIEPGKEFVISEDEFRILKKNLAILPNRMKLGIEEFLGDSRRSPKDIEAMAKALTGGQAPRKIARLFFSLTGMRLKIPQNYRLYYGQIREEKQNSIRYKLVKLVFPMFLHILAITGLIWILGILAFNYVYRPLKAGSLYEAGLEALGRDNMGEAVAYFNDAWYGWPLFDEEGPTRRSEEVLSEAGVIVNGWKSSQRWLEYARAFRARKHWMHAVDFYTSYLDVNSGDVEVRVELGEFLAFGLGRFEDAEIVLSAMGRGNRMELIARSRALGDIYLEWALTDPQKYEEAWVHYARLLELAGGKEPGLLSMMRYHLRRGNDADVELLIPALEGLNKESSSVPMLAAVVYAGTGEFLLKRGRLNEAREFIDRAIFSDFMAVRPRYTDAQYWRLAGNAEREFQASVDVLANLERGNDLPGREGLVMRIMALGNMGRIQHLWAEQGFSAPGFGIERATELFDRARASYREAIDVYENALGRNQLGASREFADLYLGMGNLAYSSQGRAEDAGFQLIVDREKMLTGPERRAELDEAFRFYSRGSELLDRGDGINLMPPEDLYRYGYVRYMRSFETRDGVVDDYTFLDFYRLVNDLPRNLDYRFALANVHLLRGDFDNASLHYGEALSLLDEKVEMIGSDFNPAKHEEHREILLRYVAIWNNRGVASFYSGTGRNEALGYFAMASDFLDDVNGDFLLSSGVKAQRDGDFNRLGLFAEGRELLEDEQTYPYRNRLMILGLDASEDTVLFSYLDIPFVPEG